MVENQLEWEKATHLLNEASRILLVTHVNPDGDAIGSMMGLANALRAGGKNVDVAVDDGVPGYLAFIPETKTIYAKLTTGKWDLMVSLDSSDEERTGTVGAYGRNHCKQIINLDHHITNTFFGDAFLVKTDAVSSTEIVYYWLKYMEIPIDSREIALPLLTGLITDTIGFRTSNVKADTLGIAQDLMQAGASITEVTGRVLDSKPFKAVKLWAAALDSIDLTNQVVTVSVTQAQLKDAELKDVSDSGLVGLLNQVNEGMVSAIFWELPDGKVKLSLRSKRGYDVGSVAMAVGGGGHMQAAGATIDGPIEAARDRIIPLLNKAVEEGNLVIG